MHELQLIFFAKNLPNWDSQILTTPQFIMSQEENLNIDPFDPGYAYGGDHNEQPIENQDGFAPAEDANEDMQVPQDD